MPRLAQSPLPSCVPGPSSARIPRLVRSYAALPSHNPHMATPSDTRVDVLRRVLYPPNTHSPNSPSPSGAHHPQHLERLQAVLPSAEAYETIERAWLLFQREKRVAKTRALEAKYKAMEEACDELDRMTSRVEEGGEGAAPRFLYDRAMARPSQFPVESAKGKKAGAESRWLEARIEGMVPREAWVPTETRGKGWNYDWKRPGSQ